MPDVGLAEEGAHFLVVGDFLEEVAAICVLGHDAETPRGVVVERLLVRDHVLVLHRRQQPHLVQRVLLLLLGQRRQLHLLQGVDLVVGVAQDLVSSVSLSAVCLRAVCWPTSKVSQTVRIQRPKNVHFVRDNMTRKSCLKVASFGCPLSAQIPGPLSAQKLALK